VVSPVLVLFVSQKYRSISRASPPEPGYPIPPTCNSKELRSILLDYRETVLQQIEKGKGIEEEICLLHSI
jgi:hypothetical protein